MKHLALALALVTSAAWAQLSPDHELDLARQRYDNGRYQEALKGATDAMSLVNFSDDQRAKMLEIAGLSAFNLGDQRAAQQYFLQQLLVNPDAQLDPFAVPPPAIKLFEAVRKDNADALNGARQQLALRLERERQAEIVLERARRDEEERRRKLEAAAQKVTVRTVELRSMLVNFVPFGAGQFQQGRVGWGVAFAVTQAVTALTSMISFFAINALYQNYTFTIPDRLNTDGTGKFTATVRRIPPERQGEYQVWTAVKFSTGGTFYGLWALGVAEALVHHQAEVRSETQETAAPPKPTAQLNLFPTAGGLGAGLTITF